jgi:serine protease Do
MTAWQTAAATVAIVGAAGIGAALAPVAQGQSKTPERSRVTPRAVQIIGGHGSQIGVSVRDVEDEDVKTSKLPGTAGVVIEDVVSDSPAATAGFRKGDVVVEFDGERVRSTRQFSRLVQETPAGRAVQAAVVRDGQRTTLTVEPREADGFRYFDDLEGLRSFRMRPMPAPPAPPAAPVPPVPPAAPEWDVFERFDGLLGFGGGGRLGITVNDLSPQLADYFGTKEGVLVTSVRDDSAAAKAGLKAGDVITSIDGNSVESPAELRRRTQGLEDGDEFTLGVVRDKKSLTLKGKVEERQRRRWTTQTIL